MSKYLEHDWIGSISAQIIFVFIGIHPLERVRILQFMFVGVSSPRPIIISCQFVLISTEHIIKSMVRPTNSVRPGLVLPARKPGQNEVFFFLIEGWKEFGVRSSEFQWLATRAGTWFYFWAEPVRDSTFELSRYVIILLSWYGGVRAVSALRLLFSALGSAMHTKHENQRRHVHTLRLTKKRVTWVRQGKRTLVRGSAVAFVQWLLIVSNCPSSSPFFILFFFEPVRDSTFDLIRDSTFEPLRDILWAGMVGFH